MKETKYYNKETYEIENKIKTAFVILIIFILGLLVNNLELQNKEKQINKQEVEIDSLKESIHLLEKEV